MDKTKTLILHYICGFSLDFGHKNRQAIEFVVTYNDKSSLNKGV